MYEWQEDLLNGITKGHMPIIAMSRRSGKSMYWARMAMQIAFVGSWNDWRELHVPFWSRKKSAISGKKIWGNIQVRSHRLTLSRKGEQTVQYATTKEAFIKNLKDGGQGW